MLVAGDSVAYHLGESFVRLDSELGFSTANVAFDEVRALFRNLVYGAIGD